MLGGRAGENSVQAGDSLSMRESWKPWVTLANRLEMCLCSIINSDQSGFIKGRNIGNNICLILDVIDYTDVKEIAEAILLLDFEKRKKKKALTL